MTTLAAGTRVLASTVYGLWIRARVEAQTGARFRIRYDSSIELGWPPPLFGLVDTEVETVGPERIALLPAERPRTLPAIGARVIALLDGKRFHVGTLVRIEGARGVVRFDEGDELAFEAGDVLACGEAVASEVIALRARGFEPLGAVRITGPNGEKSDAWISDLGTGEVFVRWSGVSWGRWAKPEILTLGGKGRRIEPKRTREPTPGARARTRWVDREHYDSTVLSVDGAHVAVRYDDGSEQTLHRSRVIVVGDAPPQIPQSRTRGSIAPWEAGMEALAQRPGEAAWQRVSVIATRGAQVWVRPESGEPFWTWGSRIAGRPPEEGRFPAEGAPVVAVIEAERKSRRGKNAPRVERRAGRAQVALGDRIAVKLADGEEVNVPLDRVWQRGEKLEGISAAGAGARVEVEREPDRWEIAAVEGPGEEGPLVKVRYARDMKRGSVDVIRMRALPPEPASPPSPPKPPAPIVVPPEEPSEPRTLLLRAIAARWASSGYRDDPRAGRLDETAISLPVDRGTLVLRVHVGHLEITADAGDESALPPPDAPLVRLAGWVQRWLGGTAVDARRERDRTWARSLCEDENADAERAGTAVTLRTTVDSADAIVRIARAVHERAIGED